MTFTEATDRAQALGMTGNTLAAAFGVRPNTYRVMRMSGPNARTPPQGWERILAQAVAKRIAELERLREELERQ